jgi:hypothetical protein
MLTIRRQHGHQGSRPETHRVSKHNRPRRELRALIGPRLREHITSRSEAPQAALLCRIVPTRTFRGQSRLLRGKTQIYQGRQLTANKKRQPNHNTSRRGLWPAIGTNSHQSCQEEHKPRRLRNPPAKRYPASRSRECTASRIHPASKHTTRRRMVTKTKTPSPVVHRQERQKPGIKSGLLRSKSILWNDSRQLEKASGTM